ncbi:IS701 family transposase [Nonomuraea sp. LPB2021202275-12-8]|uniref:IS701 family transposase n=1 Tax=Nonomuraea sp. LPB2021202275-12-8 TaxID=3120159 RepID=UPI00300C1931
MPYFENRFFDAVLGSLQRRDQRQWGRLYVRGLLTARGRKSMRAIAATVPGRPPWQNLHQFISNSPWDWVAVRRDLAGVLESWCEPVAWVVRPVVIPKAGVTTVGVAGQFVPSLGRLARCQQALGVWLSAGDVAFPVDWQLVLPTAWTEDQERRGRAGIPHDLPWRSAGRCAVEAVTEMERLWGLPRRPVVMDGREPGCTQVVSDLDALGVPYVVRVSPLFPVAGQARTVAAALGAAGARPLRRRDVYWANEVRLHSGARVTVVRKAASSGRAREYWLSNLDDAEPDTLVRLARELERTTARQDELAGFGLLDFEGRSFRGWHHHMTLVCVAYAYRALVTDEYSRADGLALAE